VAERNETFLPLVEDILPTEWFLSERRQRGAERSLWEMWHIYYTDLQCQYTVLANPPVRSGLLAVNRHERGLHDGDLVVGATRPLCVEWTPRWAEFPEHPVHVGYDGLEET